MQCDHTCEHNHLKVHLHYHFIIGSPVAVQYVVARLPQVTSQWLPQSTRVSSNSGQNRFPERGQRWAAAAICNSRPVYLSVACMKCCIVFTSSILRYQRKNYLSPVLVWFPQVISLINRFSAQSLPVSLKDKTMPEMAARRFCNIGLPNSFHLSLCRASKIGLDNGGQKQPGGL